ncbi:MAG: guanylate kinase [Lachnospiraceae bacterium]|nr:guanylate kinase [Lachnospiraceae bacterium]
MLKRKYQGIVTVISGFSGAGKGTIVKHLLSKYENTYNLSISATSRAPRTGEEEGRDYFFKTREEFEQMIEDGELLEYTQFNGNYYGTPKPYVMDVTSQGRDVILEIEIDGALQIKKLFPEALLLFVTPPDARTLKERLVGRGTESPDVIEQRLALAYDQSFEMDKYDYLIINDDLEECVSQVHRIIQSERYRCFRNTDNIKDMQDELRIFAKGD